MDEAIFNFAVEEELGADFFSLYVAGRRWCYAYGVVLKGLFHLDAALLPVGGGLHLFAVVQGHDVGHLGAGGELVDAGHGGEWGWEDGERDLVGVGARGDLFGRVGLGGLGAEDCGEGGYGQEFYGRADFHGGLLSGAE